MATLTVAFSHDYSADLLLDIDAIEFSSPFLFVEAIFSSSQFDNVAILDTVQITGNFFGNQVVVSGGSVNASLWSFLAWDLGNSIELIGSSVADEITGSLQDDILRGASGNDTLAGGEGSDFIRGGNGRDLINGGGGGGVDELRGGTQDDTFVYSGEFDVSSGEVIDGGGGAGDKIAITVPTAQYVNFLSAVITNVEVLEFRSNVTAWFQGEIFGADGISKVIIAPGQGRLLVTGSAVDLSAVEFTGLNASSSADILFVLGSAGLDILTGSNVADTISCGQGDDTVDGGLGNDAILPADGTDSISGGGGNDTIKYFASSEIGGSDTIDGGAGNGDVIWLVEADDGVIYDVTGLLLSNVEKLLIYDLDNAHGLVSVILSEYQVGNGNIDQITVDVVSRLHFKGGDIDLSQIAFDGAAIDETSILLTGIAGSDVLTGGALDETITGGLSIDVMVGNGGNDIFRFNARTEMVAGEFIDGGANTDTIELGDSVAGTVDFSGAIINAVERLAMLGTGQTAKLTTAIVENLISISGTAGIQTIDVTAASIDLTALNFNAWTGGDRILLSGTAAADTIIGSDENDTITGHGDGDDMTGNAGADTFVFTAITDSTEDSGRDQIFDFTPGEDLIDVSLLGPLDFIGEDAFSASGGAELLYSFTNNGRTQISIDVDGDGTADSHILVEGLVSLTATDFILA